MTDPRSALQSAKSKLAELRDTLDRLSVIALKTTLSDLAGLLDELPENMIVSQSDQAAVVMPAGELTIVPAQSALDGDQVAAAQQQLAHHKQQATSFNSLMVHEIRKPMTAIRGYVDMLAKPDMIGPLNAMQQQFIDTVRTNVIRMESLVTDISDVNKLTYDRMTLDPKMTTFSQLMLDVQKQIEPLKKEYEHTFAVETTSDLPILNVDAKAVVKVIMHLLRNAFLYTPKGGIITLKAERTENDLKVVITDTGIGMKPEDIARLGEAFFRADHELVTSTKGYGLGVPVAMGFLKLMTSTLTVDSTPGTGTTVTFTIPGMDMGSLKPEEDSPAATNSATNTAATTS